MEIDISQSLVFDTTILEGGIIKIPELTNRQNQNIHIVIVFKQTTQSSEKNITSLAGKLKKYANPSLIENEKH